MLGSCVGVAVAMDVTVGVEVATGACVAVGAGSCVAVGAGAWVAVAAGVEVAWFVTSFTITANPDQGEFPAVFSARRRR